MGAELLPPGRHRQQERALLCQGDRPQQSQASVTWAPLLCLPVAATKPIIRAAEPGLTLPAGASTSLTCEAGGSPPISYRWFRSAPAGTAELLGRGAELAWPSLRPSDSGTYFCEAQNRAGAGAVQRSDAVQLTVTGESRGTAPGEILCRASQQHPPSLPGKKEMPNAFSTRTRPSPLAPGCVLLYFLQSVSSSLRNCSFLMQKKDFYFKQLLFIPLWVF